MNGNAVHMLRFSYSTKIVQTVDIAGSLAALDDPRAVIEEAAQRMARVRCSPEGKEGLSAFIEKRKPNWIG